MQNKKTLKIDLDELCSAMSDSSYEHEYYLDLETGEIIFLSEHTDDEEIGEPKDKIDKEPDRYEQIPKLESHEAYKEMQDFITTVKDERLVALLKVAINGKGAFRRFKDVLLDYPEERERWFQFKGAKEQKRALEWLDDIEVGLIQE
jgi:cellulose biosynthesis protein BcsQ